MPMPEMKQMLEPAALQALLNDSRLDASLAHQQPQAWAQVWEGLTYRSVSYAPSSLAYQQAYLEDAGWQLQDISLILQTDGRPCGIFPLALGGPSGSVSLSGFGGPLMAPLFVQGLSPNTVKKICARLLELLQMLAQRLGQHSLSLQQAVLPDQAALGLSEWSQQLLAAGASVTVKHDLFVDLSPSLDEIRAGFRKSFRPLINAGLRHWQVDLMDSAAADAAVWEELKALHLDVAGRKTRSDDSWQRQFAMIQAGEAFMVTLRDPETHRLVGAGVFQINRDEGLYGVGAYDRALFDKPLGHVVQQVAIEYLKRQGSRWYRLGERQFAQDQPTPSAKQLSISAFKQGFASHVFARPEFVWPMASGV